MQNLETPTATASTEDPRLAILIDYQAGIVQKLPNADQLAIVEGAGNAQASFYFKDPDSEAINDSFYNAMLAPRVAGQGKRNSVERVSLQNSGFVEAYNALYLDLNYQLSASDNAALLKMQAKVSGAIKAIAADWNAWVGAYGQEERPPVKVINPLEPKTALILITGAMNSNWLNQDFRTKLEQNPEYPYSHMNEFSEIYGLPLSMPKSLRDGIKTLFSKQGIAGGIVAKEERAVQILAAIRDNCANPTPENGGVRITGSVKSVPGINFEPADPLAILAQLERSPVSSLSYTATASKSKGESLLVKASTGAAVSIPIMSFFSVDVGGSAEGSIFNESYVGSDFSIEVVVNNATNDPMLVCRPKLYSQATGQGWLHTDPVREALKNKGRTDVSGYTFGNQTPDYDFGKGGDLGYIESFIFSQFMELKMTFRNCESAKVRKYFEQRATAGVSFLGIPLGGASESSEHEYEYEEKSAKEIVVTMKPVPPGFIPGEAGDITQSLCNLVAVGVAYPFA